MSKRREIVNIRSRGDRRHADAAVESLACCNRRVATNLMCSNRRQQATTVSKSLECFLGEAVPRVLQKRRGYLLRALKLLGVKSCLADTSRLGNGKAMSLSEYVRPVYFEIHHGLVL